MLNKHARNCLVGSICGCTINRMETVLKRQVAADRGDLDAVEDYNRSLKFHRENSTGYLAVLGQLTNKEVEDIKYSVAWQKNKMGL